MSKLRLLLIILFAILLVQVIPAMADGPDHRPELWEVAATGQPTHPVLRPTMTAVPYPYPAPDPAPYPYPAPAKSGVSWIGRLRSLIEP